MELTILSSWAYLMSDLVTVWPDDLTRGFKSLGVVEGENVMLHASLEGMGTVDGGAAMVLHRLLGLIGKKGTLLMPTFTSIARHATTHLDYAKPGCWCDGRESRHVPFIPELQPDKEFGAIAHRLCSWPNSRRSTHPAYSYVGVGNHGDELVREIKPDDPLLAVRNFLKHDPRVLTIGVGLNAVTAIHLAVEKFLPKKFVEERALTFSAKGPSWMEIKSLGCSKGFTNLSQGFGSIQIYQGRIGNAEVESYSMKELVSLAKSTLERDEHGLSCSNPSCLSCSRVVV